MGRKSKYQIIKKKEEKADASPGKEGLRKKNGLVQR